MKIRMLRESADRHRNLHAGKEYELTKGEAYALIEAGAARQVAETAVETAAVEQPETASRRPAKGRKA